MAEIPEVDGVFGIGANGEIAHWIRRVANGGRVSAFPDKLKNAPLNFFCKDLSVIDS